MLKKFFKDGLIYSLGSILSKTLGLLLLPLYTRVLSPDDYGIIDLMGIFGNLINLTIALEITQAICIYYIESKEKKDKIEFASTALNFTFIVYSIFLILCFIMPETFSRLILGTSEHKDIFLLSSISIYLSGFLHFFQILLRSDFQARNFTFLTLVFSLSTIFSSMIYILILKMGIYGSFYGLITGNLIGCILGFYFSKSSYKPIFSLNKFKKMLKFSIPLVPSSIGVFIFIYIDRIAIKELMSTADVGIYGIAYKFASVVGIFLGGFQTSITPLIYEHYKEDKTPNEIAKIFNLFCFTGFILFLFLSLFSFEIISFFTSKEYIEAYKVVPILGFAVVTSLIYVFAPGLAINKNTKDMAFISIFCGIINTLLNFILIPIMSLSGSALATLISSALMFLLYIYRGQKIYFIPYKFKPILVGIILSSMTYYNFTRVNSFSMQILFIKSITLILLVILFVYLFLDKESLEKIKNMLMSKLLKLKKT